MLTLYYYVLSEMEKCRISIAHNFKMWVVMLSLDYNSGHGQIMNAILGFAHFFIKWFVSNYLGGKAMHFLQ